MAGKGGERLEPRASDEKFKEGQWSYFSSLLIEGKKRELATKRENICWLRW